MSDHASPFARVERRDVPVLFVRTELEPAALRRAWDDLESRLGLRGRHFVGAFDPLTGEYRACAEERPGDDAEMLGLERGVLPGGAYLRARLRGEPPAVYDRIRPTFEKLTEAASPDPTRPSLELYRRRDLIDLLLPVDET